MLTTTFRLSLVLAFAAALTFAGLSQPRVADAQATTNTNNVQTPFAVTLFVPCVNGGAGEFVAFTGEIHSLSHGTVNDNRLIFRQNNHPQGVSGVGLTTGDKFHLLGATQGTSTFQLDGAPSQGTFINTARFVGQGPDDNFLFLQHFHTTINSNGEITSFFETATAECK